MYLNVRKLRSFLKNVVYGQTLDSINTTIPLEDVPRYAGEILAGNITGHIVVDVNT